MYVEGYVGLVGYGVCGSCVDDSLVEGQHGGISVTLPDAGGNLRRIGVQTYAEEGAFAPDIFVKFGVIHCFGAICRKVPEI